jgi:hypothetical protein
LVKTRSHGRGRWFETSIAHHKNQEVTLYQNVPQHMTAAFLGHNTDVLSKYFLKAFVLLNELSINQDTYMLSVKRTNGSLGYSM